MGSGIRLQSDAEGVRGPSSLVLAGISAGSVGFSPSDHEAEFFERIIADWGPEQGRRTRFDVRPDRDKPDLNRVDDQGTISGMMLRKIGGRSSPILALVPRGQEVSHLLITRRNLEGASVCIVGWVSWRLRAGSMGCRMDLSMEQWCGSGYGVMVWIWMWNDGTRSGMYGRLL